MQRLNNIKRQLQRINHIIDERSIQSQKLSWYRLTIIISAFIIGLLSIYLGSNALAGSSIFLVLIGFSYLTYIHARVKKSHANFLKLQLIYTNFKNRIELDWQKMPKTENDQNLKHPLAIDLDIFGDNSLFRLIDQTTTKQASQLLSDSLLEPVLNKETILKKQAHIKALKQRPLYLNKLLFMGSKPDLSKTNPGLFLEWIKNQKSKVNSVLTGILIVLAILNVVLFLLHQTGFISALWIYSFTIYVVLHLWGQTKLSHFFHGAFEFYDDLQLYTKLLRFLEHFKISQKSELGQMLLPLKSEESKPTRNLQKLKLLIAAIGFRMNPVMAVALNIFVPYDYIIGGLLQQSIQRIKPRLSDWFNSWFQIDSLASLALFGWLNPDFLFAEIMDKNEAGKVVKTTHMGHPLLHQQSREYNNFDISTSNQISLITGSNMSGKSTFLRTVGINLILTFSGAPACASSLTTQLFNIQSCIRISDSLNSGLSYFYSEVKRLKEILDKIENEDDYPVLFLIDEIFKGTNNKERLLGSESYIKRLAKTKGFGLISTHDLELAALADNIKSLQNFHFREDFKDGKMIFDYKIHPGASPTTNALKIMKLEGLPVDE